MENESEQIISEQVKKLPKEVKEALASDDLHNNIVLIGEKHRLHLDQVGVLENEVVMIMMGLASPADFSSELVKQLSLQASDAEAIAGEVSEKIFLPIRDAMKKFTERPLEVEKSVVMPSAATPPAQSAPAAARVVPIQITAAPTPSSPASVPVAVPKAPTASEAAKLPEIHAADLMLSEPTISLPAQAGLPPKIITPAPAAQPTPPASPTAPKNETPAAQTKPPAYKVDPYREAPE